MATTYINKLLQRVELSQNQEDKKHFIYMRSKWLESEQEVEFLILLTKNNQNYKGKLKYCEIRSAADELDRPYEEFLAECKEALTTNMGKSGFDYEVDNEAFKLFKCEGYETLYLDIQLDKLSTPNQLMDAAVEIIAIGGYKVSCPTNSVPEAVTVQSSEILKEYKNSIEEYKLREQKLLKKCIMLINDKKARIEELEETLKTCRCVDMDVARDPSEESEAVNADDDDYEGPTQAMTEIQTTTRARTQRILDDTIENSD
ncbi:uncharacterized protein LOC115628379 [Scaptodrosophila lebanonensis]|uniref:Uncharacterized protein LOC115628379 n=1 Tax=Drosophila lebanonensis TaxID=7225 RepID=A0A6J2TXL9_DROLE|nr:uncharacterized protein LOC115628379 [Scaptodrosophila lebanonensis]